MHGYVAFNTLIFSDELAEAVRFIEINCGRRGRCRHRARLGSGAIDPPIAPQLGDSWFDANDADRAARHRIVRRLGVERVIVARELSIDEIGRIICKKHRLPLEVFIHGALCVAYSGQCLTSEALGGRSANRGRCAQACRLPYELFVDGQQRDTGDRQYLLSPQDLAAHDLIEPARKTRCAKFQNRRPFEKHRIRSDYISGLSESNRRGCGGAVVFNWPRSRNATCNRVSPGVSVTDFLAASIIRVLVQGQVPKSRGVRVGKVIAKTVRGVVVELDATHASHTQDIVLSGRRHRVR